LHHCEAFPAAQILDREQIYARHRKPGREGVAEVVEAETFNLGGPDGCWDRSLGPPQIAVALAIGEDKRRSIKATRQVGEDRPGKSLGSLKRHA